MAGASIEPTLEPWASSLRGVKARIRAAVHAGTGRGRWGADALRDIVRDYALETLAAEDAVLVVDETGFLKPGKASRGVARQYTGSVGKTTNCQIGVFAAYVSRHGQAFIDQTGHCICRKSGRTITSV